MSEQQTQETDQPAITHGEIAGVHETAADNYEAPGQTTHEVTGHEASAELDRLHLWLAQHFPDEVTRTNTQQPEGPVDLAIRLLSGLSASVPPSQQERCTESYCNKPAGHTDIHGWVHYQ